MNSGVIGEASSGPFMFFKSLVTNLLIADTPWLFSSGVTFLELFHSTNDVHCLETSAASALNDLISILNNVSIRKYSFLSRNLYERFLILMELMRQSKLL
jgi:hypothetical protein